MDTEDFKNTINIGIVTDDYTVPFWVSEVIKFLLVKNSVDFYYLANDPPVDSCRSYFYSIYKRIERKIAKKYLDKYPLKNISSTISKLKKLDCQIRIIDGTFKINLEEINDKNIDVILYLGCAGLHTFEFEKTDNTKCRILYLSPGDGRKYGNYCPGYWEAYDKSLNTHITLNAVNLQSGDISEIYKTNTRTVTNSAALNENNIWLAGIRLFDDAIEQIINNRSAHDINHSDVKKHITHLPNERRNPGLANIITFTISVTINKIIKKIINSYKRKPNWIIGILDQNNFDLQRGTVDHVSWSIPSKSSFLADPFLFGYNGEFYIFMEILESKRPKGEIAVSKLLENNKISDPKIVVKEEWHLSFPFIFKYKKKIYMLPEQGDSGELWLYECQVFPDKWERKFRIMDNLSCKDAVLYYHKGMWWCFLSKSYGSMSQDNLYIYYSDDILKIWKPHSMNPIKSDLRGSRMAGNIIKKEGIIYRPAQNCSIKYGGSTIIYEINELTPDTYLETEISEIFPDIERPKGNIRMHTLNKAGKFIAIDGTGYYE